jgi:L-histidine N-alpha-methyltransferase
MESMNRAASPAVAIQVAETQTDEAHVEETRGEDQIAAAVRAGLVSLPKRLPPWLFYDEAGSRLFEAITELPEYYLTRTERAIFLLAAEEILERASEGRRLRIAELGAGSADKTRLLLKAVVERQGSVVYEPVDVSASALKAASRRIEREIAGVYVAAQVSDYTRGLEMEPVGAGERRLVLYIGSSIGNFEPHEALGLLRRVRAGLKTGDGLLLGVDLVKEDSILLAAYDDAAGVTAAFNRNILVRLNRELEGDFDLEGFAHRAVWNEAESRIEMHLESRAAQRVRLAALDMEVDFAAGERMHTESSYKYRTGEAVSLLAEAGFAAAGSWTDGRGWFEVCLGRAE